MTYSKKLTAALALAAAFALGGTANADTFDGGLSGTGTKWEDPLNWALDAVPQNNASNIFIAVDHDVVFDAATWAFLETDPALYLQNATEHRIARLLMGDSTAGATSGTHSLTLDQGAGNLIRATNSTSTVISGRAGKFSTLNCVSGITNLEGTRIRVGTQSDGSGTINLIGGELILGRGGLELGDVVNGGGNAALNITGGSFTTRNDVEISDAGVFHVAGSAPLLIGIGSHADLDGSWEQDAGGTLRTGLDAGGITPILIDDVDDDGAGLQGNVTFAAGSILEPYDAGGVVGNVWNTIMIWEGALTDNGLVLDSAAAAAGWEMQIVANELQVRFTGTTNTPLKGDVNMSGDVTFADIPAFISVLQNGVFQAEADCNCDTVVDFSDIPAFIQILQNQ